MKKNPLALIVIPWNRARHIIRERKRLKVLDETISNVRKEYERAIANKMPHYERIYNVGLYVLLLEYDIAMLRNDALFAIGPWKKHFVARQLASLLYEASQDMPELLGKEFRASLKTLPLSDEEWENFRKITKRFNDFKLKNRIILNEIRNFVSAHRDKSAANQFKVLEKIDLLSLLKISGDFYVPMRELIPFMIKITLILGDWNVLLKHMPSKAHENSLF